MDIEEQEVRLIEQVRVLDSLVLIVLELVLLTYL